MERPPRTPRHKLVLWVLGLIGSVLVGLSGGWIPSLIEGSGFDWDMLQIMLILVSATGSEQWDHRDEWLYTSRPRTKASRWSFAAARPQIVRMILVVCASSFMTAILVRAAETWFPRTSWQGLTLDGALAVLSTLAHYWTWGRRVARPKPEASSPQPASAS